MAAPTFSAAGTGVFWATTGDVTVSVSATAGDLIAVHLFRNNTGAMTTAAVSSASANLEDLAGTDDALTSVSGAFNTGYTFNSSGTHYVWLGRAISTGTVDAVITRPAGTQDWMLRAYAFSNVNTGTTLADVIENSTAGTVSSAAPASAAQIDDVSVTTLGADRLAVQFVAVADDNAVAAFTGMTGGTWAEATAEYTSTAGNPDGCMQLQTAAMASAGTIDGGSYTMGAADPWAIVGFALIGTTLATRQPRHGFVHFNDPGIL